MDQFCLFLATIGATLLLIMIFEIAIDGLIEFGSFLYWLYRVIKELREQHF